MTMPCFRRTLLAIVSVAAVSALSLGAEGLAGRRARFAEGASLPSSRPHHEGRMPLAVDQTITRENSSSDKLRIELTHSHVNKDGKNVAFVRIVWGDLDNVIVGGGRQYYSDWDGSLALTSATGEVVRKIAFDDGTATSRPAAAGTERPRWRRHNASQPAHHGGPGSGSGQDEMIQSQGSQITWKAGVVGALDGLLIKVTSDSASISGTIVAGKFTVPFTITPGDNATSQPAPRMRKK